MPSDFCRLGGALPAGSPSCHAGKGDVAKPASLRSSGTALGAARLRARFSSSFQTFSSLFCLGGRDVEFSAHEEKKKKVYVLDFRADCAHRKNTFFPVFVHFCSQNLLLV